MEKENTGYVVIIEDLKQLLQKKTDDEKSHRSEYKALQEKSSGGVQAKANTSMIYKRLAASRLEVFEAKQLVKQVTAEHEADRLAKNRMVSKLIAKYEADIALTSNNSRKGSLIIMLIISG